MSTFTQDRQMLVVVAPDEVATGTGAIAADVFASWVERVLDVAERLYPSHHPAPA
jgi:hypothetical protein